MREEDGGGVVGEKTITFFHDPFSFHIYRTTRTSNIRSIYFGVIVLFVFRYSFTHDKPAILLSLVPPNSLGRLSSPTSNTKASCVRYVSIHSSANVVDDDFFVPFRLPLVGERHLPKRFKALKTSRRRQRASASKAQTIF